MDNADVLKPNILEVELTSKTKRREGRDRMQSRQDRFNKTADAVVLTGLAAIALGSGVHKVLANEPNHDSLPKNGVTIEMSGPMPSQNLPIVDERNAKLAEVAGIRMESPVAQDEKSIVQQEQKDPHPNAGDEITEQDIQNALKVVPEKFQQDAKVAIPLLAQALKERGVDSKAVFAYMLATVEYESMFKPMEEIDGREQAIKYNYPGGEDWFGRGYIMTTGKPNYEETGRDIGEDIVDDPDLLLTPKVAAEAAVSHFIKHGTINYAQKVDFVGARRTVNGGEFDANDEPFKSTPYKVAQRGFDFLEVM